MSKYLSTVMKVLPVVQARQISDLLQNLRAKGELRDAQDYQRALADLTKLVNAKNPKPMYEQLRAIVWGMVRSDVHNTMMQTAKNDLEAVFLQTDEIGRRLDDHHFYLMQGLISDLEKALQDQEDRIREFKMKATKNNEFTGITYNSFARTSLKKTERSDSGSELLFFDNRTSRPVTEEDLPSVYVSEHGKKIVLASQNEPKILPVQAKLLYDEESYGTDYTATVNNNISNVIDGVKNTFWSRTVYTSEPVERISTVMEFDLGTGRDINYCIIEGATTEPFFVTEMWGVGLDGQTVDLLLKRSVSSEDLVVNDYLPKILNEVLVDGWARIDFQQTFAKAIRVKFTYGSFKEGDYFVSDDSKISALYEAKHAVDMKPSDLAPISREIVLSPKMAEICNIPKTEHDHVNSNVYTFSLDNVWFGNSLYADAGIFVSQPIHLDAPGVVSLKTKEKNVGVYVNGTDSVVSDGVDSVDLSDDIPRNAGSVEYELVRYALDNDGRNNRDHFPIPYLTQSTVLRERLVLTKRLFDHIQNDVGALRFCPRTYYVEPGSTTDPGVHVFGNGKRLDPSTEWQWAASKNVASGQLDPWFSAGFELPEWWNFRYWNLTPQKLWIQINNPKPGDIYTVSYTIRTSQLIEDDISHKYDPTDLDPINYPLTPAEGRVFMDQGRMVYMGEEGRLHFLPDPETGTTKETDIFTQITLRRNAPEHPTSPEVLEYALLSAPYKPGIE